MSLFFFPPAINLYAEGAKAQEISQDIHQATQLKVYSKALFLSKVRAL